jgi:hypothetical protein
MSINKLLKMSCNIERSTIVTDVYKNTTLTWAVIKSNAKCYVNYLQDSAKIKMGISGETLTDLYKGFFSATEDILPKDKISISGTYFYVRSSNMMVNARNGSNSHIECLLSSEET